jgi:uncharacterized membrane protein HdeD (DUF308 family)
MTLLRKAHSNRRSPTPKTPPATALRLYSGGLSKAAFLMILLGVLAIVLPVASSLAVNFLIGVILTFMGLAVIVFAGSLRGTGLYVWAFMSGLFPLCIGLYLLIFPTAGLMALTFFVAIVVLVTGVSQTLFAFEIRPSRRWQWVLVSGLISTGLGITILVMLPEASRILLGIFLGVDLVSTGLAVLLIATAKPDLSDG